MPCLLKIAKWQPCVLVKQSDLLASPKAQRTATAAARRRAQSAVFCSEFKSEYLTKPRKTAQDFF